MRTQRYREGSCGGDSRPVFAGLPTWSTYNGVPQTPRDAKAAGWNWLTVECLHCRRVSSIELEGLSVKQWTNPLSRLRAALRCKGCGARDIEMAFAESERGPGRRQGSEKTIWFQGSRAVRQSRN